MKTYTLKLNSGTAYKLYDGTTLVSDADLGTLFGAAGSAYFVFDFNSGTPSDLTAVSITDSNDTEVMGTTGLAAGTVKENYNFKGAWDGTTTTFTSFAQLAGQALDEAEMSFLMGKVKESLGNLGKAKVLTSADYNWNNTANNGTTTPFDCIAGWLLEPGSYTWEHGTVNIKPFKNKPLTEYSLHNYNYAIVGIPNSSRKVIVAFYDTETPGHCIADFVMSNQSGYEGRYVTVIEDLTTSSIVDNLTSTSTSKALSANQGKILKDFIGDLTNLTTTDKTNLVAAINEAAAGGGSITVLTTADYNYPESNPTSVAAWLLEPGMYTNFDGTSVAEIRTSTSHAIATFSGSTFIVGERNGSGNSAQIPFVNLSSETIGYMTANGSSNSLNAIPAVVQTTGTSTTDVMSQNAVTSMVFADPATQFKIKIGAGASTSEGNNAVEIGHNAGATANNSVALGSASSVDGVSSVAIGPSTYVKSGRSIAIGDNAAIGNTSYAGGIALGAYSSATAQGEMNIGSSNTSYGYNNSNYRLITGVYDPQSAHDAATKGYVDNSLPASFNTNEWNALWA